jgi:Txe/YoeB family toxin of toxin-antitoxin system
MAPKYEIDVPKVAEKDLDKLLSSKYRDKAVALLRLISEDPYRTPPPIEYLGRKLKGCISRRINIQHRLVYEVHGNVVRLISCWTHYHE